MFKKHIKYFLYLVVGVSVMSASAGALEDWFRDIERDNGSGLTSLMRRGMDPNIRDEKGQVGLFLALRTGSFNAAAALLDHPGIDLNVANNAGETPVMMAALRGQLEWTRRLVEHGARVQQAGWTALHYAATGPDPKVVEYLLARGAAVDALSPNGTTPLMMAAGYGSEASVDLLLRHGANAKLRNQLELDVVEFARQAGREVLVKRLEPMR